MWPARRRRSSIANSVLAWMPRPFRVRRTWLTERPAAKPPPVSRQLLPVAINDSVPVPFGSGFWETASVPIFGSELGNDPGALRRHPRERPLAVSQLCSLSGGSTTTALRHIEHLEALGYISRETDITDRRRANVMILPALAAAAEQWSFAPWLLAALHSIDLAVSCGKARELVALSFGKARINRLEAQGVFDALWLRCRTG